MSSLAHAALIFLLKHGSPVVRNYVMSIFSEPRRPKCYSRIEWEDCWTPGAAPVLKLTFDIINVSDDPIEVVDFKVSHPTGIMIVENHADLLGHLYENKPCPALTAQFAINEELDGQKYEAKNATDRQKNGRREYVFYCIPKDENDAIFSMKKSRPFSENIAAFIMRYRHADELGRTRKMTVAAGVPDMVKSAA